MEAGFHDRETVEIASDAKPRLPRGVRLTHNEAQGGWVLLAPERVFKADRDRGRDRQALHRRGDVRRDRRRSGKDLQRAARAHTCRRDRAAARAWPTSGCWSCSVAANGATPLHKPLGLLAELTHRCPLGCPYCSNPLALDPRTDELDTATWARVFQRGGGARRVAGASLRRRARRAARPRRDHQGRARGRALHQSDHLGRRHHRQDAAACLSDAGLDHVQVSIQDSTREIRRPYRRLSTARSQRKRALAAEVVRLKLPLTVNAVMHRANIERIGDMVDLALTLGATRVEIAHVQYYGWALKNRAMLMPTREQVMRAAKRGRGPARAPSRPHRHRRGRARLLRAPAEALRRRLGPALAQCHAGRQGAAVPRRRDRSPGSNSGTCATIRSPTSGRIRRRSTPSAAPPGCRSRARAARSGERGFRRLPLPGLRAHRRRARRPIRSATLSPSHARVAELAAVQTDAPYDYRRM